MTTDSAALADSDSSSTKIECRPFLKWAGGKTQLLPELLKRVPPSYNRYLEPFLGGGALYFSLQPKTAYLADYNPELINCFEVVRSNLAELKEELRKYRYDKEMYYEVRELDRKADYASTSAVARAARFIYLNKTCFNGLYRVNSKGHFNVPFGAYKAPTILDAPNLTACSNALQSAILKTGSFEDIVEIAEKGDFVYFDPPYAPVSETADFTQYVSGGFDASSQELLLLTCLKLHQKGVKWMLSNSNTNIIQELYRGFKVETVEAGRAINSNAEKRGPILELIIRNY
jgi:DNA adenine methylase